MEYALFTLGAILCIVLVFAAGWFAKGRIDKLRHQAVEEQTRRMLEDAKTAAENLKREKLYEVREEHQKLKTTLENEFQSRRVELTHLDKRLRQREQGLNQRIEGLDKRSREIKQFEKDLREQTQTIQVRLQDVQRLEEEAKLRLEGSANVNREQALAALKDDLMQQAKAEVAEQVKEFRDRARLAAAREAREMVVQAIQRSAADHSTETTVTVVNIESDEIKGRIIGREGRNIRAFEACTGVEVIIDDTPEAVTLSAFDPYRREVARIALEHLIADGRIHPARIEDVVKKSQSELEDRVVEIGHQAIDEVGIDNMHPELVRHLGKLHYRTSYGQNVLKHSVEVARLSALLAIQLGLEPRLAARAGLLHDIGKSIDRDYEGTHTELGVQLVKKYNEPAVVVNSIASHHDDVESTSLISNLVQAADAISGARPGARRDSLEGYIKRLEKLETIANSFPGVSKTFAIQAGREIRVMVENDKVTDALAELLAQDIAKKIQSELEYPGQIRVTVIREFRAVEFAR